MKKVIPKLLLMAFIFCSKLSLLFANSIYVDQNASGENDGSSWEHAFIYLQDAISIASHNDVILVADGTYRPDRGVGITSGDRTVSFVLNKGVMVKGGYAGYGDSNPDSRDLVKFRTTLSGDLNGDDGLNFVNYSDNSKNVVYINDTISTSVLDGVTVIGGNAYRGGGIKIVGQSYSVRCTPVITNIIIVNNFASDDGGGILNWYSNSEIINCVFVGNTVGDDGAAIRNYCSDAKITNCTFVSNRASAKGACIYDDQSNSQVSNCIMYSNYDYRGTSSDQDSQITLMNNCHPVFNNNIIQGWLGNLRGTENSYEDPFFLDIDGEDNILGNVDDDLRLQSNSPAIDAGSNSFLPIDRNDLDNDDDVDELIPYAADGLPRFRGNGGVVDIGAFESGAYCGDEFHDFVISDLNNDCYVNMQDFVIFVSHWLYSNNPSLE